MTERATPRDPRYSARTILRAQRRVLKMTFGYLSNMSGVPLHSLRTDGNGLMTLGEVLAHIEAAMNLKEKRNADDLKRITAQAKASKMTVSEWVRGTLMAAIQG